jgi:GNAT superfamily N-acetyltransferase
MMEAVELRPAHAGDWPAIWPFWHRIVAAGQTYAWDPATDEAAARRLWMLPPPARVYVAGDGGGGGGGGRIVGTALLKPNQPGLGDHVANAGFMVDPDAAGRGVGRALARYVLDEARLLGYRGMQFNAVVESNTGAVTLWRSLGFAIIATVPKAFRHPSLGLVGLHIMYREL